MLKLNAQQQVLIDTLFERLQRALELKPERRLRVEWVSHRVEVFQGDELIGLWSCTGDTLVYTDSSGRTCLSTAAVRDAVRHTVELLPNQTASTSPT